MLLVHAHDPSGLAEDHLDDAWVFLHLAADPLGDRGDIDSGEVYDAALGLRDHFLTDDEQILGRYPGATGGSREQRNEVVAGPDRGYSFKRYQLDRHAL